jgi:two-component system, NarL family, response regulator YdfI
VTTVLITAPSAVTRAGLAALLAVDKRLHVVIGASELSLPEQIETVQPDVLLIDLGPERGAGSLPDWGAAALPGMVILTDDARRALDADALRQGGRAVLPRHASASEIIAAIESAANGLVAIHPDSLEALQPAAFGADRAAGAATAQQTLTARETEVLAMIADGLGNKIIAARLGISTHTVKFHIASIFAKLNAGSRTEAVTIGIRQGLLMI